jgi:hypothetical protein
MAVDKQVYGEIVTYTGTLAEVAQAVSDDQVPFHKFTILYNGTNITAVWKI